MAQNRRTLIEDLSGSPTRRGHLGKDAVISKCVDPDPSVDRCVLQAGA
jgi:hypothetical protein